MGISNLLIYINDDKNWTWPKAIELKADKLVVDGSSMCYELYKEVERKYPLLGGQYPHYRSVIKDFIASLRRSGIKPIFLFDGIYKRDRTGSMIRRQKSKIETWAKKLKGYYVSENEQTPPLLLKTTFLQTLEEFETKDDRFIYFVDEETDPTAVSVANYYDCPVVSGDSDYFMFHLNAGFIPISRLQWREHPVKAQVFKRADFFVKLSSIACTAAADSDDNLCLAIPAIRGNDSIQRIQKIQQNKIHDLIVYISECTTISNLLEQICGKYGQGCRDEFETNYKEAKKYYNVITKVKEDMLISTDTQLRFGNGDSPPEWIVHQYRQGKFAIHLMMTAVLHENTLSFVPDDLSKETAHKSSKKIREVIYKILTPKQAIKELIREKKEITEETVEYTPTAPIELQAISRTDKLERIHHMKNIFGVSDHDSITCTSDTQWHLVVLASCYWVKEVKPTPPQVKALALSFVLCHRECHENDDLLTKKKFDFLAQIHTYAQWQCIYLEAIHLNNLLQNPLKIVSPAYLFDDQLVMHYATQGKKDFDKCIKEKLEGKERDLFYELLHAINGESETKTAKSTTGTEIVYKNRFAILSIDSD